MPAPDEGPGRAANGNSDAQDLEAPPPKKKKKEPELKEVPYDCPGMEMLGLGCCDEAPDLFVELETSLAKLGGSMWSRRLGASAPPVVAEPEAPPTTETEAGSSPRFEEEGAGGPVTWCHSASTPRTGDSLGFSRRFSKDSRISVISSSAQEVAKKGALEGTHFFLHWFGARRFDYEDQEEQVQREDIVRRMSSNHRELTRELFQENFTVRRRSSVTSRFDRRSSVDTGSGRLSGRLSRQQFANDEQVGATHSTNSYEISHGSTPRQVANVDPGPIREATEESFFSEPRTGPPRTERPSGSDAEWPSTGTMGKSTTAGTKATLSSWANKVGGAVEGGADLLMAAKTSGRYTTEDLVRQHWPCFTLLQVLVCTGFWVSYRFIDGVSMAGLESALPGRTLVRLHEDCQDFRPEVWRWLSYQFTHVALTHVLVNVLIVIVAGLPLEGFHGLIRTMLIFNIGVAGGAAFHQVVSAHSAALAGMSAGCYSLLGMHWSDLAMNWRQSKFRRGKLLLLLFLVAVDVLSNTVLAPGEQDGVPDVSHASHVGGFVTGLLAGILVVRNLKVTIGERVVQGVSLLLFISIAVFTGIWLAQWPPRGLFESSSWCWMRQANNLTVWGDMDWHCIQCKDATCIQRWTSQERSLTDVTEENCYLLAL